MLKKTHDDSVWRQRPHVLLYSQGKQTFQYSESMSQYPQLPI